MEKYIDVLIEMLIGFIADGLLGFPSKKQMKDLKADFHKQISVSIKKDETFFDDCAILSVDFTFMVAQEDKYVFGKNEIVVKTFYEKQMYLHNLITEILHDFVNMFEDISFNDRSLEYFEEHEDQTSIMLIIKT